MSKFIAASGNLAEAPELRHDDESGRAYTYLRVLVSDDYKDGDTWHSTPPVEYRIRVIGKRAESIAAVAQASGNIAVVFAGEVDERPWGDASRGGINRTIHRPTIVGYDSTGQEVTIAPRGRAKNATETPAGGPF